MKLSKEIGIALAYLSAWVFGVGFLMGFFATIDARTNNQTGCVYRSVSSLANPGYVMACELFRKRYEYGNISEVFQK